MSTLVVHLCWTDADPEHLTRLQRLLPPRHLVPEGPCLHRRTWLSGSRVLGIEVWGDDDEARRHLAELPLDSAAAGLEPPTVVACVYPDVYRSVLPVLLGTADARTPAGGTLADTGARR
ncbi:hypothetical protein SAMN04488107_1959 [Geodermatophilus saharensis]|uniref:Antibiotic biosynthesis monooxygenase n=1 Tax=Geodermatophilus saharensis TaxID=1137994 RepID=A0A239D3V8_9ACTN|nr:hypothetical protein [Geodermatophilus saharensis]SNS26524.1 hypothetical protein SAMN04488107_1959 [Geodermatophilus saharensis]